jgi:drug/metabolite transporter (DMT)-like permease
LSDRSPSARVRRGTLAAWALVLFWGFHYVVLYRPLRLIDPERYLFLRFGWAASVVLILSFFFPFLRGIGRGNWGRLLLLSLVGIVGYQWVFLRAASLLDPVPLVLILSMGPVIVAVYSHIRGQESFSPFQWGAMGVICFGIFLVVRGEPGGTDPGIHLGEGLVMAFFSLFFFTISTFLTRSLLTRVTTVQTTLVPVLLGGLILLPFHPDWLLLPPGRHEAIIFLSLLYSIFVALFLCYFLWNMAVSDIGPARAGLWSNGQPLVAACGSVAFLGHHLSWGQVFGGLLALGGYWIFFGKKGPLGKLAGG